jgi:hypothetical protein
MSWNSTARTLMGAGLVALGAAACTQILGDDFAIDPNAGSTGPGAGGGSSTSGTGGATTTTSGTGGGSTSGTGGAGGGGGMAPPTFSCSWKLSQHQVIATAGQSDRFDGTMLAVPRDSQGVMRVYVRREDPGLGAVIQVIDVDEGGSNVVNQIPGVRELHDADRLSSSKTGALFSKHQIAGSGLPERRELFLLSVDDNDSSGASFVETPLTSSNVYPEPQSGNVDFEALMVVNDINTGTALPGLELFAAHEYQAGEFQHSYGRWTNQMAIPPIVVSPASPVLTLESAEPRVLTYYNGKTYAFAGQPGGSGLREYELDQSTNGTDIPRLVDPGGVMLDVILDGTSANVSMASLLTNPALIYTGKVAATDLFTFVPGDLNVALSAAALTDLPVSDAWMHWIGDMFTMVGGTQGDETQMAVLLLDADGNQRAQGMLPFNGSLGANVERVRIDDIEVVSTDSLFDTFGGDLNVLWLDEQQDTANANALVQTLYFDVLRCLP